MAQKVTAVFDIGKTNKKLFLFDKKYKEVYREYANFEEIKDEDGHPTENIEALQNWIKELFFKILQNKSFEIKAINFSTYGASFVHLDENGQILTPLYNYTKPLPKETLELFNQKYGTKENFSETTGATVDGMLNSGLQLFWLKHTQPKIFNAIKYSLHLPQYLSYIFTGIPLSEYTSIGCHTALWDYKKNDYHNWVYKEEIHLKLPPLVSTETSINMNYHGKPIKIGVGIHDSSSALLPYIKSIKKKFLLVSTGTWSITLNPFSNGLLKKDDIQKGCINYMQINGQPVKASRLFLGKEHEHQVQKLTKLYDVEKGTHKTLHFNVELYLNLIKSKKNFFRWQYLENKNTDIQDIETLNSFEEAYHQLMIELTRLQVESIKSTIGNDQIKRVYVDGGFSDNHIYISLLSYHLKPMKLRTTNASLGSALGAAICLKDNALNSKFLKTHYALKKYKPFIIS